VGSVGISLDMLAKLPRGGPLRTSLSLLSTPAAAQGGGGEGDTTGAGQIKVQMWLQKDGMLGGRLLCVAVCCSVLQCVAVCCSVLQCVAVCISGTNMAAKR